MRSRKLARALVLGLAGCTSAPPVAPTLIATVQPLPPPLVANVRAWSWQSVRAVLDRHVPVPADALGLYFQPDPTTVMAIRGPEFDKLCGEQCERPYAARAAGGRFFYVAADRRPVVIEWVALGAVLLELEGKRGAGADRDADVAILRGVIAKHRVPNILQAWLERRPDGTVRYVDELPHALEVDASGPTDATVSGASELPLGVVVSNQAARVRLARPAGELTESDRAVQAAVHAIEQLVGSIPPARIEKLSVRALEQGWIVSAALGPCDRRTLHVFVDEAGQVGLPAHPARMEDYDFVATSYGAERDCPPNPRGRRPAHLRSSAARGETLASALFGELIHDEAASVPAFHRLADELAALGGPASLIARAHRAAADEARHAEAMTRIGSRVGAIAAPVDVADATLRSAEAIAIENAVEGRVHEGFAAVVCELQATRAHDPELAAAMTRIVEDEHEHVDLAADVASWLDQQLTGGERGRVERAFEAALHELPRRAEQTASRFAAEAARFGLPTPAEARWLAEAFVASFARAGARYARG